MINLHIESEFHLVVKITDVDLNEVRDETGLSYHCILMLVEDIEKTIINDAGQLCVLYESHFIYLFLD
jgi:hypothetical protein